jgi:ATP-dependent protease HslVU (ClpYQ) peptidase subunit
LSERDLIITAANLSRAAPEQWDKFVAAYEVSTMQKMAECVSANIDMLAVAQGRAQACAATLALLKDCRKNAEKIYAKASPSA